MNGSDVFMFTKDMVLKFVNVLPKKPGITIQDVDLFVFYPASKLVTDNLVLHLDIRLDKVFTNYKNHRKYSVGFHPKCNGASY
jgi:3-oxoacyl-[acyl-carrier-protein] synthase III